MSDDFFLFVSHVTEDRAAAMAIVAELEKRGVRCWIAPRNIAPGSRFDDQIADAIEACRAMLLIFSDHCNHSEYIHREITVAGESHKLIIPFRIEEVQPKRGLRVRLSDLHWIDGFVERERAIDELAAAMTQPPETPRETPAAPPQPAERRAGAAPQPPAMPPKSRAWMWRAGLIAAAGIVAVVALYQFLRLPIMASPPVAARATPAPASQAAGSQLAQVKQAAEAAAAAARDAAAKAQSAGQRAEQEAAAAAKGAAGHYAGPQPAPGNADNRYEGQIQSGANGGGAFGPYGVFTLASGERIAGQFDNFGVPNGDAVATWANGDRYDGQLQNINGRAMKSGYGVLNKAASGDRYEGQFASDTINGYAVHYGGPSRNFVQYEGEFAGGSWNGTGVALMKDGSVAAGTWKNGVLQPAQTAQE